MKRPPRAVIDASIRGSVARLVVVDNGAGLTTADLAELVRATGVQPRQSVGAVLIPARALPDVEALAKARRVVVQRTRVKSSTTVEVTAFQPQARSGVDDQAEPVHGCAGAICRTRGCHRSQVAS